MCSSGGATGLCLWHYQFCSLLPTKLWLMKPSSSLISISLFIFIMAETAHRKQRPWWTNNTPASCFFCPLSLIWRERERPVLIAIWSTAQGGEEHVSVFFVKSIFFFSSLSLSLISISRLYKISHKVTKHIAASFFQRQCYQLPFLIDLMPGLKSQSCLFTLP